MSEMTCHEKISPTSPARGVATLLLIAAWACTAFGCCGALVGAAYTAVAEGSDGPLGPGAYLGRAVGFGVLWLGLSVGLARLPRVVYRPWVREVGRPSTRTTGLALVIVLALPLLICNLDVYPWAAPDEIHHLNVAKNLAERGLYASGNPERGFRHFDPYDSVGPTVLLPVAASMYLSGSSSEAGRRPIILFAVLFLIFIYRLLLFLFDSRIAALAALLALAAFSTLYLSRTLYGEVPALAYFLGGLLAWRRALESAAAARWGLLAGCCFGAAILGKTILILSGFCFLAVIFIDWIGPKRIRLVHLFGPGAGAGLVLGIWWLVQYSAQGVSATENAGDTFGLYRHYLLFGLSPLAKNFVTTFGAYPLAHFSLLAGFFYAGYRLLTDRYDPAALVLLLCVALYAFWWAFYTPGQLPRYLWTSYACGAAFTAPLIARLARACAVSSISHVRRGLIGACIALMLWTPCWWLTLQAREVFSNQEMQDDLDLAAYLGSLSPAPRLATDHSALRDTLGFLMGRTPEDAIPEGEDGLVIHVLGLGDRWPAEAPGMIFGRYQVVEANSG